MWQTPWLQKQGVYATHRLTGIRYSLSTGMIKKVIQQGRSHFEVRSVLPLREHSKMLRTLLMTFFIIPIIQTPITGRERATNTK